MASRNELMEALNEHLDAEDWDELAEHLSRWRPKDEHFHETIIPYIKEKLADWDEDEDRLAPTSWIMPLLRQPPAPVPLMALATGIDLDNQNLTARDLNAISKSPELAHINHLSLAHNTALKSKGIKCLARSRHLTNLQHLDLEDTGLGNDGARALARWPGLAGITWIDLDNNPLDEEVAPALRESEYLDEDQKWKIDSWCSEQEEDYEDDWE